VPEPHPNGVSASYCFLTIYFYRLSVWALLNNNVFVNQFDVNQACYIEILAGIAMEKNESLPEEKIKNTCAAPYLRVVK
jgi:hypothetical protein